MDYIEDDDFMEGVYTDLRDFAGGDEVHFGRRTRGGGNADVGPMDVTFSVFVDPPPGQGEVVMIKGNLEALQEGVVMNPCETGSHRLWRVVKQIRLTGAASAAAASAPMGSAGGLFGAMGLGSLSSGVRAPPALFDVTYSVVGPDGQELRKDDSPTPEHGPLRPYYYHKAKFSVETNNNEEVFPLFFHDEVHLLQSQNLSSKEFLARFVQLAQAPFARKRHLLDKALGELIMKHWGKDARPPPHLVLAIAATLGYFRRQSTHHSPVFAPLYEDHAEIATFGRGAQPLLEQKEKEKEQPPSLIVCRWIVRHCPAQADVGDEEDRHGAGTGAAGSTAAAGGGRERRDGGPIGSHQLQRYTQLGVLQAAETLYMGEKTFEWLKLMSFLPEHAWPPPLNASQCPNEEREKLVTSFINAMAQVFSDFQVQQQNLHANKRVVEDTKERQAMEHQVQAHIELFMRGLCTFCPSVDGLLKLIERVMAEYKELLETVTPMVFNRIRSLHFGPADKEALKKMIRDIPFMHSDEVAIALLTNQHHPSESFPAYEITTFVKQVTETRDGVRPAGPQLQSAIRRWLMRHYGRPPERPERKEERQALASMSQHEYQSHKEEIREAIRGAIRGWHMVLALPCFSREEETLRMILFELSQAYFFKDPDPLLVLDCMLDLEHDIMALTSVRQLLQELQRIAIKSVRDAQDTSEVEHAEELLRLLFDTPTPLRFAIIDAFIGFRQAAADLGKILANEPIWARLLSPAWVDSRSLADSPLGLTQKNGSALLTTSAQQLQKGTIHLSSLHTILQHQQVYEKLVTQVLGNKPTTIPQSAPKLHKFDTEFVQLRVYVKMFCASAHIEAAALEDLIENIKDNYATLELNIAASKFEGLAVRPHLPWLYSLRGSDVFAKIWKQVAIPSDGDSREGAIQMLKQEFVVSSVIPKARENWEKLSKSVETGSAILKEIRWCVELEWSKVQRELELLETTTPKNSSWVPRAVDLAKDMRLAAKLREWAPSMLHLCEVLCELFTKGQTDATVEELRTVVKQYEHMWEMPLGKMTEQVAPYRATISLLREPMQNYTITMAKHDESLRWLLQHKSTEDFNRLISLCRPNTDDPVILAAIASLQQTRTSLAEVLYTKPPYRSLKSFLEELANLTVDDQVQSSLMSVQHSFAPLLDLLITNSRTPGVQACYSLKRIFEKGTFNVICSLQESEQLVCQVPDGEFNYEALAELRRQLLMTDVPAELDGAKNLPGMLEQLVEKLQLLEEYGRCTRELFTLGHFAYQDKQRVLTVTPSMTVAAVEGELKTLQQKLSDWQKAVDDARGSHYFLNYFTVRELCFLVKTVPAMSQGDGAWQSVWPLLRCADLQADAEKMKGLVKSNLRLLHDAGASEVKLINALGTMLDSLFSNAKPQVRPLHGLRVAKQQLQGDLLIRSMQNREQGVPIFLCCTDEPSKVTELVLSIYTRRERVPEAEELLLCSAHTTIEEIELLLRRFFFARKYKREERLYCIGNVHLLPYVVQCGTIEALRRLEERFGFDHASALVFVSGHQNQMLTNALNRHNLAVSILPQELLTEAVSKIGEMYHGRQLEAVASQMNGVGKTHHILREVHKLQKENKDQPILHHVEIRETTGISTLVSALLADPTNPKLPTAIHIDLAHILPSHVDTLLFEVLIVGMLRDMHHCTVYHRRRQDFFFVEIPNTPGEYTAKQLSFCLILPRTYLRMSAERLDSEWPTFKNAGGATLIGFEKNNQLEIVGKTLEAMKKEAFNPKSKQFNKDWTAATTPAIDARIVYGHLEEVCSSEASPPSFLIFMNFVKFLGHLVHSAEDWNMMNLNLLQNFDPGLKHFKHCFFRLLIETSRDFALRQVPKQMPDMGRPNPLAPPAPVMLQRGGSGGPAMAPFLARSASGSPAAGPAALQRQGSAQVPAQEAAALEVETTGVGRIDVSQYVRRFDQMPSWESCVHPIASFKKNEAGTIVGCSIMSLQREFIGNFIDRTLQNSLHLNDLKLERDWSKVTHQEAVQQVHLIEGGELLRKTDHLTGPTDYVVTVDNLLKLMSIQQRLKYGLPVILMGETGCGKTALVRFLAKTLDFRLRTLDIHGGITDERIMDFLDQAIDQLDQKHGVLVFFDEINAANCMALFKTIIIDRMYGNKRIPPMVRIISCCNPYRLRRAAELEEVALVFQHHATAQASGISDPMKRLVYRVHPLPESLIDVVSDFGALSEKSEEIYVNAILRKELPRLEEPAAEGAAAAAEGGGAAAAADGGQGDYDTFVGAFKELLCQSQTFVREVNEGERSVVSMRDVARAARVFKWFLTHYSKLRGASLSVSDDPDGAMNIQVNAEMKPHLRSAVVLTLGYCYHSRLNRDQRWGYRRRLCDTWKKMKGENPGVDWLKLDNANDLSTILVTTQHEFVSQMELGEGIALNEALRENLFMLLVSIMNQIPILLIGKPGCSKSLAITVLQNNLNGEVSNKEFFKGMPAVEVIPYQCSPLSTPDAILGAFQSARQSNLGGNKRTIVCVLLDEVGLAEESPHLPLKVLHKELEDLQGIACVGISNWALDAAKMSRCVTLYRPPPTVEDLCVTAEGMVASANLKGYLRALSEAFFEIYRTQPKADFWGMREFYSTVRVINAELKQRASRGQEAVLEPPVLMKTVQRNFGGQPSTELENCIEEFFEKTGMSFEHLPRYMTPELIRQNLSEPDARHLMLLTKNNAALRLLFESSLVSHDKAEVLFGSTFPNDQSDIFVALNLQRIKTFMLQPISLILVHCDSLYESLYDLLNQHYMEYAGQRYVRIAHGSKAKQCPIHRLFRVIVITEIHDAYFRLAPPLLNRFEKQIFLRKDLMTKPDEALLNKLSKFWEMLLECMSLSRQEAPIIAEDRTTVERPAKHSPVAGFHAELLSSLVFTLRRRHKESKGIDELFDEAKKLLTWVLTPEAVCITAARLGIHEMQLKFGFNLVAEYFEKQKHSELLSFAEDLVNSKQDWCDDAGAQVMVMTYSPVRGKIGGELKKLLNDKEPVEVSLHELSSSQDIEKVVHSFYSTPEASKGAKSFLLIHADPVAASLRMIEHCRFVCEKARSEFLKRKGGGSMFVVLIVHLQRGVTAGNFSFDFDSHWHFVFLDSVEPTADLNSMPSLGDMLNMPLIEVVKGLDFKKLLKNCFRSSLSRLIYPHSRNEKDLGSQIQQILSYLEDTDFIGMIRTWVLQILDKTPRNPKNEEEGSIGEDKNWFAAIATAAHELALAGTFRAALHNRIVVLVGSLLTVLLAHLDRNGGLSLLSATSKRSLWLSLSTASLTSPLSTQLHHQAVQAISETVTAQHEVGTDAQTGARPFKGRFPASWFVSRSIDGVRHIIESLPQAEQLKALTSQYEISKLHEVGLDPSLSPQLLEEYLGDFTAMHVDWTVRIDRDAQARILTKTLQRLQQSKLTSILQVHQLFWNLEKGVAFFVNLLNAVPKAVPGAEKLIDGADLSTLNLELLLLVHQTLTNELLGPVNKGEEPRDFYHGWLQRKMVVSGLTKDILVQYGTAKNDKLSQLKTDTEPRLDTVALLLQHVAHPLKLPLDIVKQFLSDLPKGKVRHSKTLLAILQMSKGVAGLKYENSLPYCSAFCESWILDVCLRDAEAITDLDESCLRLVCSIAAGLPVAIEPQTLHGVAAGSLKGWSETQEGGIATLPSKAGMIPRSSCLNLALLRKLLITSVGDSKKSAHKRIEELLKEIADHEKHNDTTFATRYAVLCEEEASLNMQQKCHGPNDWNQMSLQQVFKRPSDVTPAGMLQNIGEIRLMLTKYAACLCEDPISLESHHLCVAKVGPLLETEEPSLSAVCRQMRLYLLKCVERSKGISFLRGLLAEAPLSETSWVKKWRDMHDIDFEKFIGAALVPKWNPFSGEDASAEYREAKAAVIEMMTSTATDKLDAFAKECRSRSTYQQKRDIGGLLLALCQEPGLLAALEEPDRRPAWRSKLNDWLANTKDLPVTDKERMLLRIFAGDETVVQRMKAEDRKFFEPFVISGGRKMPDLLRWRLLGHLASVCVAAPASSLLAALRKLMLEPRELMDGHQTYLPGMDEDIRNRVMKALLERGENIWKFKSHWYKCSCGYTFFIGECGRPMEVAACPACGKSIGGRDHNKTTDTVEDDESDRSPAGYMLPPADKDEKHISFREVPASSARCVRLLLHGAMFVGLASHIKTDGTLPRVFDHLINQDSTCTMREGSEAKYIGDHFSNDWQQMVDMMSSNVEDLAAALHSLLRSMHFDAPDIPKAQAVAGGGGGSSDGQAAQGGSSHSWDRLGLHERNSWEETVEAKYITNMVKNYDTSMEGLYKKWGGAAEDGKFVSELKESADVRDFPREKRNSDMPQLWAFRSPVTLDALHAKVGVYQNAQETLPVLCTVLQQPLFPVLRALGQLVGVFEWHQLVLSHFSGRITRTDAANMKVGEILSSFPPNERKVWERAYRQFERAWHIAWPYVERHDCLQLSDNLKQIMINRDTSMVYCIADSVNEGICPLALTQWLVGRHNELVQVVAAANGFPTRKVSSRLLDPHDVIQYDENELMRFLRSRCVTYGVGGKLNFDFKQLEQQLRRELARPELTMELRGFQWLGESFAAGNELKTVIKQRDISPDVAERVKMEISSTTAANAALQKVQMSISFILKSGGGLRADAGEMLLGEYLRSVLSESPECIPSSTARAEVHLCHVDAFARVLKSIINKDPMDNVDPKYKADLPKELEEALLAAKPRLPDELIQVLGTFGESNLTETTLSDTEKMSETLNALRDFFNDMDCFTVIQQELPSGLQMKHWAATYRLLRS